MPTDPTVPLPDGMRVLSDAEYDAAFKALRGHVDYPAVASPADALTDTLAAIGVFLPPLDPEPDTCTALYLPHRADQVTADVLGVWQQCADEPGHDPADVHDSGEFEWRDGDMGAVPARPADEEA
ncbi:hypothetical protein [Streptomyces sp. NPDC047525]|uniref:hypothetical protein n=1 Tax=Streptomyces sp. NPDC047525 TaxID=3155264 RepID=UPI0033F19D70